MEVKAGDPLKLIVDALSAALADDRPAVRARAAEALGSVGRRRHRPSPR